MHTQLSVSLQTLARPMLMQLPSDSLLVSVLLRIAHSLPLPLFLIAVGCLSLALQSTPYPRSDLLWQLELAAQMKIGVLTVVAFILAACSVSG